MERASAERARGDLSGGAIVLTFRKGSDDFDTMGLDLASGRACCNLVVTAQGPLRRRDARCTSRMTPMRDLPIFLNMRDRPAIVVGSGVVAARRADLAVRAGARVTVFAPALSDEFLDLLVKPNFRHAPRDPEVADLAGRSLCFIATEDEGLIERTRAAANSAGALVNVADRPDSPTSSCLRSSTAARW